MSEKVQGYAVRLRSGEFVNAYRDEFGKLRLEKAWEEDNHSWFDTEKEAATFLALACCFGYEASVVPV